MARIAFLVADGFDDAELRLPFERLSEAGHEVETVGQEANRPLESRKQIERIVTHRGVGDVSADEFDAVVIPGGFSPDVLRLDRRMVALVHAFNRQHKLIGAIGHGPSLLIDAGILEGRTVTSWPSIKADLENAGAHWVDREVQVDDNLVTARKPADLPEFIGALLNELKPDHVPHPKVVPAPSADLEERVDIVGPH